MSETCNKSELSCIHRYINGYDDGFKDGHKRANDEFEMVKVVFVCYEETKLMNYEEFKNFTRRYIESEYECIRASSSPYINRDERMKFFQSILDRFDSYAENEWNCTEDSNTAWRKIKA